MAEFGQYRGDSGALLRGSYHLQQIRDSLKDMERGFREDVTPFNGWYGTDDEFAKNVGPAYERGKSSLLSTLEYVARIVGELAEAKLTEMREVQRPQNDALEQIKAVGDLTGGVGTGGRRRQGL
ncbi:hypothetical protein ABZ770_16540 [Streptomyces sp. NPDC006654]|uniref:hypothetical protein n=1 Tax=Streptomyces sp. NPDC006654 TaxID=3156897 RepID=UPI0033E79862